MDSLSKLAVMCGIFAVVMFAYRQLGLRKWPAFFIAWGCIMATAAVVQVTGK